jgi:hypothetical protein
MWRYVLAAWILVWPLAAAAKTTFPLKSTLTVEVDRTGAIKGEVTFVNQTGRSLCLLPGWNEAHPLDADGHILGNPVEFALLWPSGVDVIWDDKFVVLDVGFNPATLRPEEAKRFVRANYYVKLYDCIELIKLQDKAKPTMTLDIPGTPEFLPD